MHSYEEVNDRFGRNVSRTIDAPIMVLDHFVLGDAFAALGVILVFGVILFAWKTMMFLLVLVLGVGPVIRKRHPAGIFLHWPYRFLGISLPGLINPQGKRRYSD